VLFPFTDLSSAKLRPAVILSPSGAEDFIVAFITSQDPGRPSDDSLVPILRASDEFSLSGLLRDSWVRVDRLATVHRTLIQRKLGVLGPTGKARIHRALSHVFFEI